VRCAPDDTINTAFANLKDHIHLRLPQPAKCDPRPRSSGVARAYRVGDAMPPAFAQASIGNADRTQSYPNRTVRIGHDRAPIPDRANKPDSFSVSIRGHNCRSRMSAALWALPGGTTGRCLVHSDHAFGCVESNRLIVFVECSFRNQDLSLANRTNPCLSAQRM
jgi:hypothetical protein